MMLTVVTVAILILFGCHYISSDNTILTREESVNSVLKLNTCTEPKQCSYSDICIICKEGRGPDCEQPTCINGICGVIQSCSQDISSSSTTTTAKSSNNQCTGTDTSNCVVELICARCKEGYSPGCSESVCINNQCKTIPPCSIYTSTASTTSTISSVISNECQLDNECLHPEYCAVECKEGYGPLCASAKCVKGKCQVISPCSQPSQCTNKDISQCIVPQICARCLQGYSPPCAQAACDNGQCKVIQPCSISTESTTTTTTPQTSICTRNSQCPRSKICAVKCDDGTTPLCASAKCVNGKCINIKPCSQRICKTSATCPYNKRNCAQCLKGYGPNCEQPACTCGVCSIVQPCSKKLNTVLNILSTERK